MTTLEAIYENGIFKPVAGMPQTLREHERVRIIIETDTHEDLLKPKESLRKNGDAKHSAARIVDTTFGSTRSIERRDLISLAEDNEFSGY